MNKKILLILFIIAALLISASIIGVKLITSDNPSADTNPLIEQQNTNQDNSPTDITSKSKLTSATLDLYNEINPASTYLSSILYNPFEEGQGTGDSKNYNKVIVTTYDIGADEIAHFLKNDFLKTASSTQKSALWYYFALEGKEKVLIQCTSTNYIREGSMHFSYFDNT